MLEYWWPDAIHYSDVRSLRAVPGDGTIPLPWVDCIVFGSPCKNLSSAGDRSGLDGPASRLFWDCLAVVGRVRPRWVVFENVASGASLWVDRVRGALEQLGYETVPIPIAASDLGAPHRRGRVFIIVYTDRDVVRDEPGGRGRPDRTSTRVLADDDQEAAADVDQSRQPRRGASPHEGRPGPLHGGWRAPVPDMVRVANGRAARLDGARQRVAALGDSCVPQCAEVIGHIVRLLDG